MYKQDRVELSYTPKVLTLGVKLCEAKRVNIHM